MQSYLDPASEQFLYSLTKTTARMNKAQAQISSGKRFTAVSDDPDQVSTLLQTRLELDATNQVKTTLSLFKTEVDTAEGALDSAEKIMDQARTLAAQGVTTTATPESRAALAEQIDGLLERMVGISNTQVQGRYIFSGNNDGSAAFTLDMTATPPYTEVAASVASTREAPAADGTRFAVARNAHQLFNNTADPTTDVLGALDALRTALRGTVQSDIETATTNIQTAGAYLRDQHAWYGSVQLKVNSAIDNASERAVRFTTQLGTLEDADMAEAIVDFTQGKNQRDAALQAHSQMPSKSLFDYLG